MLRRLIVTASLIALSAVSPADQPLQVAVAANFRTTLQGLAHQYQQRTGQEIRLSSASTGVLYNQIRHGAPFDLFFAADHATPAALNNFIADQPKVYALGQLVLWCPRLDLSIYQRDASQFAHWYSKGTLAYANPKLAPYGLATEEVLEQFSSQKLARIALTNNVAQVAQLVMTGHVECGFLAQSLLPQHTTSTHYFTIPNHWHTPIEQSAVITQKGATNPAAADFLAFVLNDGRTAIANAGYQLPERQSPDDRLARLTVND